MSTFDPSRKSATRACCAAPLQLGHTFAALPQSHPRFFVDDLKHYKKTLEWFLRGGYFDQYLVSLLQLRWFSEAPCGELGEAAG